MTALWLSSIQSRAQIPVVDDTTSTPIPGVGHDYIHMLSETVNPANGSVSVRVQLPVPKGRGFTLPFSIAYDSNSVNHLVPGYYPRYGTVNWAPNIGTMSQGGWSYVYPGAGAFLAQKIEGGYPNYYTCNLVSSYLFRDVTGAIHGLNVDNAYPGPSGNPCTDSQFDAGGDSQVTAVLTGSPNQPSLTVYSGDGTVYNFGPVSTTDGTSQAWGSPHSIEDRNGNEIVSTSNGFTDTLGRPVIAWNGFGPAGSTNPLTVGVVTYQVNWESANPNFPVVSSWAGTTNGPGSVGCSPIPSANDIQTVVHRITLPNSTSYTFYYGNDTTLHSAPTNPYGLLSEIDYPSGGWVQYRWGMPGPMNEIAIYPGLLFQNNTAFPIPGACGYQYQTPVVLYRYASFGGNSPVTTQAFAYGTNWNPPLSGLTLGSTWATKTTNVTTTDNVTAKSQVTLYTYTPVQLPADPYSDGLRPQIPVESSIAYYDWTSSGGGLLRTVNKAWSDPFLLTSEQTVLENGLSSQTSYTYGPYGQVTEKDEYDFGQTTASRITRTAYEVFIGALGKIADRPCKTVVYNGSGKPFSETDYLYDGGTAICGNPGTPYVTNAGGSSLTGHDEPNFGVGSTISRGNLTTKIERISTGPSPTTTYTYDETGQLTSMTDPNGNVTQYSYSDSFVSTNTGGYTTTGGSPPGGMVTNAYLTSVTRPATATNHLTTYTYGYNDGELTTTIDENRTNPPTTYRYNDLLDRLTETDYPDNGQTTVGYSDASPSPSVTTTKKLSSTTSMLSVQVLDGMGHPVQDQLTDPEGATTSETAYTGTGSVLSRTNPHRSASSATDGTTTYIYDGFGRTRTVTDADGSSVQTAYATSCTPNTNVYGVTVTDEAGKSRTTCSDGLGRMVTVFEDPGGLNYETDYQYDLLNNLLTVTQKGGSSQANWRTRSFAYDWLSRLTSATNPESGIVLYSYDPNGNVTQKTDARGIQTVMKYDALNRLTSKSYSDGTPTATFYYDTPPVSWGPGIQNTNGRLVEATTGISPEP
jgi:YD repeat-containing protein